MEYPGLDEIMEEIAELTPSYRGINYRRLQEGGIHWPCPDIDHPGTPCLHIDRFTCGLGVFHAIDFVPPDETPDGEYPLYLTTGRVLYQYHTGTMTMKSVGLNNLAPGCFVEIAPEDAEKWNIAEEELVRVISRRGELTAHAMISEKAIQGTVFLPFHFADAAANLLTNSALDPVAKIPEFKVCAVRIEKNQADAA
jgi:predicted molibdopterin-dependent oxidoreductase YjgC